MKRVAIILGSPFPQSSEGHLRGVNSDVINYKNFLLSSDGGAWREDEIHTGIHIGKSTISKIQTLCKDADIAYVIYSGHGYMRQGENYININPNESIKVSSLYTKAKRQVTIIDACRTNYPYEHFEGIAGLRLYFDNTRPDIARALYDGYIQQTPYGLYTMFSCSEYESSQDTSDGGRFTVSLLRNIKNWSSSAINFRLTAYDALNMTFNELVRLDIGQTPAHQYSSNGITNFPFSISTKAYLKNQTNGLPKYRSAPKVQKSSRPANNFAGILTLAVLGTIIVAALGD